MKKIEKGIVFSDDIKRILKGYNAFDFKYDYVPSDSVITSLRDEFRLCVNKIFGEGNVTIINEEEMMQINRLIGGEYPHCYIR